MGNGADDKAQAFERAAGFAGQTEHERFVHDDCAFGFDIAFEGQASKLLFV